MTLVIFSFKFIFSRNQWQNFQFFLRDGISWKKPQRMVQQRSLLPMHFIKPSLKTNKKHLFFKNVITIGTKVNSHKKLM